MAAPIPPEDQQRVDSGAQISVRIGTAVQVDAHITATGLLAFCALVSGALLGSAAIVLAAKTGERRSLPNRA